MIHETETVVYHNSNREKFKGLKINNVVGEEIICKATAQLPCFYSSF